MSLHIHSTWKSVFKTEQDQIEYINKHLSDCLKSSNGKIQIFPYPELVFSALNTTPLNKVKVVILGQDPYFNQVNEGTTIVPQAMGLSFSIPVGVKIPSSLQNIFKNLKNFGHMTKNPNHGNLITWAYQGCLLLNTALTVPHGHANQHAKYWKKVTDAIIKYISNECDHVVFMLWGSNALDKKKYIDETKHLVTASSHPSGLSCHNKLRGYESFMSTDHFGKANDFLTSHGQKKIMWEIANV